MIKSLYRSCS